MAESTSAKGGSLPSAPAPNDSTAIEPSKPAPSSHTSSAAPEPHTSSSLSEPQHDSTSVSTVPTHTTPTTQSSDTPSDTPSSTSSDGPKSTSTSRPHSSSTVESSTLTEASSSVILSSSSSSPSSSVTKISSSTSESSSVISSSTSIISSSPLPSSTVVSSQNLSSSEPPHSHTSSSSVPSSSSPDAFSSTQPHQPSHTSSFSEISTPIVSGTPPITPPSSSPSGGGTGDNDTGSDGPTGPPITTPTSVPSSSSLPDEFSSTRPHEPSHTSRPSESSTPVVSGTPPITSPSSPPSGGGTGDNDTGSDGPTGPPTTTPTSGSGTNLPGGGDGSSDPPTSSPTTPPSGGNGPGSSSAPPMTIQTSVPSNPASDPASDPPSSTPIDVPSTSPNLSSPHPASTLVVPPPQHSSKSFGVAVADSVSDGGITVTATSTFVTTGFSTITSGSHQSVIPVTQTRTSTFLTVNHPTATFSTAPSSGGGPSIGAIVGPIIAILAILAGALFYLRRRRATRSRHHRAPSLDSNFVVTPFTDHPNRGSPMPSPAATMTQVSKNRSSAVPTIVEPTQAEDPFADPTRYSTVSSTSGSIRTAEWELGSQRTSHSQVSSRPISFAVSEADSLESNTTFRFATATALTSATPAMVTLGADPKDPFADPVNSGSDSSALWRGPNLSNLIDTARGAESSREHSQ